MSALEVDELVFEEPPDDANDEVALYRNQLRQGARKSVRAEYRRRAFGPTQSQLDTEMGQLAWWTTFRTDQMREAALWGDSMSGEAMAWADEERSVQRYGLHADLEHLEDHGFEYDPDDRRWFDECGAGWDEAVGPDAPSHAPRRTWSDDEEPDVELERVLLLLWAAADVADRVERWEWQQAKTYVTNKRGPKRPGRPPAEAAHVTPGVRSKIIELTGGRLAPIERAPKPGRPKVEWNEETEAEELAEAIANVREGRSAKPPRHEPGEGSHSVTYMKLRCRCDECRCIRRQYQRRYRRRNDEVIERPRQAVANRFATPCELCGLLVRPGVGIAEWDGAAKRWAVRHVSKDVCADLWRRSGEPVPVNPTA